MKRNTCALLGAVLLVLAAGVPARGTVLTFDRTPTPFPTNCHFANIEGAVYSNYGDYVGDANTAHVGGTYQKAGTGGTYSYGDAGGPTPHVLVDYTINTFPASPRFGVSGFSDLTNVGYIGATGNLVPILFTADPGRMVRLDSFDLGAVSPYQLLDSLKVYDDDTGELLWDSGAGEAEPNWLRINFSAHTHVDLTSLAVQAQVLRLELSTIAASTDRVAVDNIQFSEIPEPAGAALLALGGLALLRRRRAKALPAVLALAACLWLAGPAGATQWHIATAGTPGGAGTAGSPWDIVTGLGSKAAVVQPGDTVWIHGGDYFVTNLHCWLVGTPQAPIVVRAYPGERPTIRTGVLVGRASWVNSRYVWLWGLEVADRGFEGNDSIGDAVQISGYDGNHPGIKVINCILHDCIVNGVATWAGAHENEVNGCLIYNNGYDDVDRGHGHGFYIQSRTGPKLIKHNIIFRNFHYGSQLYGEDTAPRNYVTHQGNVVFNNSELSLTSGRGVGECAALAIWGGMMAEKSDVLENLIYAPPWANGLGNSLDKSMDSLVQGNLMVSSTGAVPVFRINNENLDLTVSNNTFYGSLVNFTLNQYGTGNVQLTSRPTQAWVIVQPNDWERGRAHITVFNWPMSASASADISALGLPSGTPYAVRDAQNFYAAPVASGTYTGTPISIPMTGLTVAQPQGLDPNYTIQNHTAPEFAAFVLLADIGGANFPPVVSAGLDHTTTMQFNTLALDGAVLDDGLPSPPGATTATWSRQSGPSAVTFADAFAPDTMATFAAPGTYVLRLTAGDSLLTAFNETTVTVHPTPPNEAPTVNAGSDLAITLPTNWVSLDATASDDGLPVGSTLTASWTHTAGPGAVTFANAAAVDTTATFAAAGTQVLRLTVSDSALIAIDDVVVTVNPRPQNQAPVVDAGPLRQMSWPINIASLDGAVTDDGQPDANAVSQTWSLTSGPGSVTFATPGEADTTATFSTTGTYVLRLTAGDTGLTAFDEVAAVVDDQLTSLAMHLDMEDGAGTLAQDITGNGHNGTLIGGPTWVAGKVGGAVHFDEVNDYIRIADFGYGPQLSVSLWFRLDDNAGTAQQFLLGHGYVGGPNTLNIYVAEANAAVNRNKLVTTLRDGDDATAATMVLPAPLDGLWHLYTLTVQTGLGAKVYLDGGAPDAADAAHGGNAINPTTHLCLGCRYDLSNTRFLGGSLDDVRLYNRALTQSEVDALIMPANYGPTVRAGASRSLTPQGTLLDGTVSDDGMPDPPGAITASWSQVSGPAGLVMPNPNLVDAPATFTTPGTYVLRLTASDSQLAGADEVAMTILPAVDLRADFNGDGAVTGLDFVIWQGHFPTASGASKSDGDANGDGAVNGTDFVIWQAAYQP